MKDCPVLLFSLDQGDWAWLKRLPDGTFRNINPKTSNVFELVGRTVNISIVKEISMTMHWRPNMLKVFVPTDERHAS